MRSNDALGSSKVFKAVSRTERKKILRFLRYKQLYNYENNFLGVEMFPFAGVDEAGRGPLAGPVVAAAVILPPDCRITAIDDSKQLTAKQREEVYGRIMETAVAAASAVIEPAVIDRINIYHASYLAMNKAVEMLPLKPKALLIDGPAKIPGIDIMQFPVIRGDGLCLSIAAASIIAKVTRDRLMINLEKVYPGYGFAVHKGYPTKKHREALRTLGPSPVHRLSFTLLPEDD